MRERTAAQPGQWGLAAAVAVALTVGGAGAATIATLGASGVEVTGDGMFTPEVTERTLLAGPGTGDGVFVAMTVEHFPLPGRETLIDVIAPDGTSRFFVGSDDPGWSDASGVYAFAFAPVSSLGTWRFRFADTFPDGGGPDISVGRAPPSP